MTPYIGEQPFTYNFGVYNATTGRNIDLSKDVQTSSIQGNGAVTLTKRMAPASFDQEISLYWSEQNAETGEAYVNEGSASMGWRK